MFCGVLVWCVVCVFRVGFEVCVCVFDDVE